MVLSTKSESNSITLKSPSTIEYTVYIMLPTAPITSETKTATLLGVENFIYVISNL